MRFAVVAPIPPIAGGIAQHSAQLIKALRKRGHTVKVVTWKSMYPPLLYKGERTRLLPPLPDGANPVLTWWNPMTWLKAGHCVRGSDAVILPWVTPFHAVPIRVVAFAAQPSPLIAVVHNVRAHEGFPLGRQLVRSGLDPMSGFITHSGAVANDLRALHLAQPSLVVAHPPNLDLERSPLPPSPPYRLVALGYVRRYKGISTIIEAVRILRDRSLDIRLTIAGDFWISPDVVDAQIAASGLTCLVNLVVGYLPDMEVGELLRRSHVVVAAYESATQSGVVPLAFAAGRPVVATAVGGLAEQIENGRNGELAAPGNPVSLADAIQQVLTRLSELSIGAFESTPSWEKVAAAVEHLADPNTE